MTLPTESVLNWSSEKPAFEKVKGKVVYVEYDRGSGTLRSTGKMEDESLFSVYFNDGAFLRYAIIAEPLEAKELWGVKARVMNNIIGTWFWVECGGLDSSDMFISTKCERTEAAAIREWNQLVDKVGER